MRAVAEPVAEWLCLDGEPAAAAVEATPAPAEAASTETAPADPNPRYLYSPSSQSLGQGHVSQKQLVITSAAVGITDHWDVQVGTFLPTLFVPGGSLAILGTKFSASPAEALHVAAGAQITRIAGASGGLAFGGFTIGGEERHFTTNLGLPFGDGELGQPIVTLSGLVRFRDNRALVTETWLTPAALSVEGLQPVWPSAAFRFIGDQFSVDAGAVLFCVEGYVIPLPWLDFTWRFSLG